MSATTERRGDLDRDSCNTTVVKSFLAATYEGQLESAFDRYAQPDLAWIVGTDKDDTLRFVIPWAGCTHKGHDGFVACFRMLFSEFENLTFEAHRFTDIGDAVFVEGYSLLRHRETGKLASSDWFARVDMKERRIAGGQLYVNTFAIAAARVEV